MVFINFLDIIYSFSCFSFVILIFIREGEVRDQSSEKPVRREKDS